MKKVIIKVFFQKFDWIFINQAWLDTISITTARFLLEGISDHCPAKITLGEDAPRLKKQFKYCNVLAQHSEFLPIVEIVWRERNPGCKMFLIMKKLKMLKRSLKSLNARHFKKKFIV